MFIVCTLPFLLAGWDGGGGMNLLPNLQKGPLAGSQSLERVAGKEEVTCSFYTKSKVKSEIFNGKKVYKQKNVFLCPY